VPEGRDDPFDTAALRQRVMQAWAASPARLREDANAEEDYALGGYRDRPDHRHTCWSLPTIVPGVCHPQGCLDCGSSKRQQPHRPRVPQSPGTDVLTCLPGKLTHRRT
jgi:hypothetical protein